jgi:hypothetical protein
MDEDRLRKRYSQFTRSQLLNIVDNQGNYTDLAISIALDELSRRGVWEEDILSYEKEQFEKEKILIEKSINYELNLWHKMLFFSVLIIPFFGAAFRQNFLEDGHMLKLKQAAYYSRFGFFSIIFVVIISIFFVLGNLISLSVFISFFLVALVFDNRMNRQKMLREMERENYIQL